MGLGAGSFLSSLHLLALLPLWCQVQARAARCWSFPTSFSHFHWPPCPLSGPEELDGASGVWMLTQGGRLPTFSLVDIWYPRGFSVSPPGQMIFLSLGMTWGWEYEMEGGHAGVLAPGP